MVTIKHVNVGNQIKVTHPFVISIKCNYELKGPQKNTPLLEDNTNWKCQPSYRF